MIANAKVPGQGSQMAVDYAAAVNAVSRRPRQT